MYLWPPRCAKGMMGDDPARDRAATRRRVPPPFERSAPVAQRACGPAPRVAVVAALEHELVARERLPPRSRVAIDRGERRTGGAHDARRRITADVAPDTYPGCPVDSATSAPGTWRDPHVPRSCATASATWLSPWTYPSERCPPCVFTGTRPPSAVTLVGLRGLKWHQILRAACNCRSGRLEEHAELVVESRCRASATSSSSGPMPAIAYNRGAIRAAALVVKSARPLE